MPTLWDRMEGRKQGRGEGGYSAVSMCKLCMAPPIPAWLGPEGSASCPAETDVATSDLHSFVCVCVSML